MKRILMSIREGALSRWLWVRGVIGGILLFRDPNRLDEVFAIDRALPKEVREAFVKQAQSTPWGRVAIETRHRTRVDLMKLRALPLGTFGRDVADFYDRNGLTPSAIPTLEATDAASYVQAHLYETHDLWHVALGFGSTVADEMGLQAVYAAQLPGRLAQLLVAGGLLQSVFFVPGDFTARLASVSRGYSLGTKGKPLFGAPWDEMWELTTAQVRERIGLETPPHRMESFTQLAATA